MDKSQKRGATFVAVLVIACASGCGGGGSDATPTIAPPAPTGGVDRGGVAVGTITGFGSIIVNGVHYETTTAQFTIDDNPGTESDLRIGHVVTVVGTVTGDGQSGTATRVEFDNDIEGPVDSLDLGGDSMVAAGQTILVNDGTVFDDDIATGGLDGLGVGDRVEVSGFFDADGNLVATRIQRNGASTEIEIHGVVASLDAGAMTFTIGQLTVNYASAVLEDFPSGGPLNGDFVEVEGTAFDGAGALIAAKVENEDDSDIGDDGDNFEVEGFITALRALDDFDVGTRTVATSSATQFENGTAADLAVNVKVEVEGSIDANGVLNATKVELKPAGVIRVAAPVEAVDAASSVVTALGLTFAVTPTTQLEDDSDAELPAFSLNDLSVGDYVEMRGAVDGSGAADAVATRLERDNPDDEVELRGFVDSVDAAGGTLVIFGVSVMTQPGNAAHQAFLDAVSVGDLVEVDGTLLADGVIAANELEFEGN